MHSAKPNGATPNTTVTHIAIQAARDSKVVDWLEQVGDEQYLTGTSAE